MIGAMDGFLLGTNKCTAHLALILSHPLSAGAPSGELLLAFPRVTVPPWELSA